MSRHRAAPPHLPGPPANRHRAPVRPRYGRITALGAAVTVTCVALLGGVGIVGGEAAEADHATGELDSMAAYVQVGRQQTTPTSTTQTTPTPTTGPTVTSTPDPPESPATTSGQSSDGQSSDGQSSDGQSSDSQTTDPTTSTNPVGPDLDNSLPADSGEGQRVVFSQSRQRVWLVADDDGEDTVKTSYLVSGSVTDNLDPGTYEVYSRSEQAYGVEDSGTMNYFVRFAQGDTGAAIGFHDIPEKDGVKLQTQSQLGTPQSHGCIRQRTKDALSLWKFAPLGTTVVVMA